jgi:hypothetical protein
MRALQPICDELLQHSRARAVTLRDATGATLAHAVDEARADAGPQTHRHVAELAGGLVLDITFDDETSLGLVRLRAKKASVEIARARARPPEGSGGAAPAVASLAAPRVKLS